MAGLIRLVTDPWASFSPCPLTNRRSWGFLRRESGDRGPERRDHADRAFIGHPELGCSPLWLTFTKLSWSEVLRLHSKEVSGSEGVVCPKFREQVF